MQITNTRISFEDQHTKRGFVRFVSQQMKEKNSDAIILGNSMQ
jgi:hypothetical protein